jgi:hypothetical protein
VARRAHKHRQTLKVHVTFEPNRICPDCVAQAYEQVVPITRRSTARTVPDRQAKGSGSTQPVGRRQAS